MNRAGVETQFSQGDTMVITTAAAVNQDKTMNRDSWFTILDSQDKMQHASYGATADYPHYLSASSYLIRSPERAPSTDAIDATSFHSPSRNLESHDLGTNGFHALENSPFSDLANDPVASENLSSIEPGEEASRNGTLANAELLTNDDRKPPARTVVVGSSDQLINGDPLARDRIELSYSDDRATDDENKHSSYEDYNMHAMGEMSLLAHHPMHDPIHSHSFPIWRPEFSPPGATHAFYPPLSARTAPLEYTIGGSFNSYSKSSSQAATFHEPRQREPPLGALTSPTNAKRVSTDRERASMRKPQPSKKAKIAGVPTPPFPCRRPSPEELQEAKTSRARAALNVWYERLTDLISYKQVHGDCNVPQKYHENPALGIWVNKQRMEKKFMDEGQKSSMTPAKLQALDEIGFQWAKRKGQPSWDARYAQLKEYFAKHGHCRVPTKYVQNPALGRWVSTQRSQFKQFMEKQPTHMTVQRMRQLEEIGFKWNAMDKADDE